MRELIRALPLNDVEVIGRTLEGQALRWDTLYRVTDDGVKWYREGFRRGAFGDSLRNRGGVFELRREHHDYRLGIVSFTEGDDGLNFRAALDFGDDADDELELVRSGRRAGVSIRYTPQQNEKNAYREGWWRTKVDVRELSLTARPQYGPDAKVLAMRNHPSAQGHDAELAALLDWQPPEL